METPPFQETPRSSFREKHLEALHNVAGRFGLRILDESTFNNTPTLIVEDGYGGQVHIGFPDRMDRLAATDKICGITTYPYGHGAWRRGVDLNK